MTERHTSSQENPELSLSKVDRFMADISDEKRPILEAYLALDPEDVQGHMVMLNEHGNSFSKMTIGVSALIKEYGCSFDAMKEALLMRLKPEPVETPRPSAQAPVSVPHRNVEPVLARETSEFGLSDGAFNGQEDRDKGNQRAAIQATMLRGSGVPRKQVEQQPVSVAPALTPKRFFHILDETGQAMLKAYLETDPNDDVDMDVLRELYGKTAIDDIHEQVSNMGDSLSETRQEFSRILAENGSGEVDESEKIIESDPVPSSNRVSFVAMGMADEEIVPGATMTNQQFVDKFTPQGQKTVKWFLELGERIREGGILDEFEVTAAQRRAYGKLQSMIIDRLNTSPNAGSELWAALPEQVRAPKAAAHAAFSVSTKSMVGRQASASPWLAKPETSTNPLGDFLDQFSLDELMAIQAEMKNTSIKQGGAMAGVQTPVTELIRKSMGGEAGFENWDDIVRRVGTLIAAHEVPNEVVYTGSFSNSAPESSPWSAKAPVQSKGRSALDLVQQVEDQDDFVEGLTPGQQQQLRLHLARVDQAIRQHSRISVPDEPHAQEMANAFQYLAQKLGLTAANMRNLLLPQLNSPSPKVVIPGQPEELALRRLPEAPSRTAKTVVGKQRPQSVKPRRFAAILGKLRPGGRGKKK